MKSRVAFLFLALAFAISAHAQSQKAADSDAAKNADIRRLLEFTGQSVKVGDLLRSMLPQLRASFSEYQRSMPPDEQEKFNRVMDQTSEKVIAHFEAEEPRLREMMVPIYAKYFSHEDIKAILQFYESPVGQRFLAATPRIIKESFVVMIPWMQEMNRKIRDEMLEALRKEFPNVPFPKKSDASS
jgi:hypothetical protein